MTSDFSPAADAICTHPSVTDNSTTFFKLDTFVHNYYAIFENGRG